MTSVSWMWSDAHVLSSVVQSAAPLSFFAKLNPLRWSSWKSPCDTCFELEHLTRSEMKPVLSESCKKERTRPVRIMLKYECNPCCQQKTFASVDVAIAYLREMNDEATTCGSVVTHEMESEFDVEDSDSGDPEAARRARGQVERAMALCTLDDLKSAVQLAEEAKLPESEYLEVSNLLAALLALEDAVRACQGVDTGNVNSLVTVIQQLEAAIERAQYMSVVKREIDVAEYVLETTRESKAVATRAKVAGLDALRKQRYWDSLSAHEKNKQGERLQNAARDGNAGEVSALLAAGVSANGTSCDGQTALHLAALSGHRGIADTLLIGGALVTKKNREGRTPADMAALADDAELAVWLRVGTS